MKNAEPCWAVIRTDRFWNNPYVVHVTIKVIVWSQEEAEREVERLNGLNADKHCKYHWEPTRAMIRP